MKNDIVSQANFETGTPTDIYSEIIEDDIAKPTEDNGKGFRLQSQRIFLTYSAMGKAIRDGYLEKEMSKETLKEALCKKVPNKAYPGKVMYIAQEEHRDGDIHFHVVMDLKRPLNTRKCRFFDIENWHPNISKIMSDKNWIKVLHYISKSDKETGIPKNALSAYSIWNSTSLSSALVSTDRSPMDIKIMWENRPATIRKRHIDLVPRPWQAHALKALAKKSDRSIYVYVDTIGNCGKSYLGRYCRQEKTAWVCKRIGNMGDFSNNVRNAVECGWNGEAIIIDLPRAAEEHKCLYDAIEEVKDGLLTGTKYNGGDIEVADQCSVLIFSNFWPQLHKNSLDRWRLFEITDKDAEPVRRPIQYILNLESEKHQTMFVDLECS